MQLTLIYCPQLCDHQRLMKDKGVDHMLDLFALVVGANFR
jgi:hypothetical protein